MFRRDEKKDKQLIAAIDLLHGKAKAQILAEQARRTTRRRAEDAEAELKVSRTRSSE